MTFRQNIALLCASQALLFVNNVTLIIVNGLAGFALASNKALATLPVSTYVVGSALAVLPASHFMQRNGRRAGFVLGSAFGLFGTLVCTVALFLGSFWTLCLGTWIVGAYNAFGQQYRFAASELAAPDFRARAISLVLAGGIAGGIIGPELSKLTKDFFTVEFLGAYASLMVFAVISMGLLQRLQLRAPTHEEIHGPARPLFEIVRQPAYVVAVLGGTVGYGVMNLLMSATPLAMGHHHHPYSDAAFVIEWHVVGMFAPGFFTGHLIRRFGVLQVMFVGVLFNLACVAVALAGVDLHHFWVSLFLLGVGWNFMYTGATTLLTETHRPTERAKAQGFNDLCIFATMAVTSFSSGVLLHATGWSLLNYLSVPFIILAGVAIVMLLRARRARPRAA